MKSDLPQVCQVCRKLKAAALGKFRRGPRYSQWIWECLACLENPKLAERKGESPIEREVRQALASCRVRARQEFKVAGFSFDFAVPELRLLLEADSATWHTANFKRDRDRRKDLAAKAAGWKVARLRGADMAGQTMAAVAARQAEFK